MVPGVIESRKTDGLLETFFPNLTMLNLSARNFKMSKTMDLTLKSRIFYVYVFVSDDQIKHLV